MSRYFHTLAITLSRRDHRESDRMFSFYTENFGKVEARVVGAKKTQSKLSGHLEPFGIIFLGCVSGWKGNRVTSAQRCMYFSGILSDMRKATLGGFCLRLAQKLIKGELPDTRIFTLLRAALEFLHGASSEDGLDIFSAVFALKLLRLLGYEPQISRCIVCHAPLGGEMQFFYEKGGGVCMECRPEKDGLLLDAKDAEYMRHALEQPFQEVFSQNFSADRAGRIHTVTSRFLQYHLS